MAPGKTATGRPGEAVPDYGDMPAGNCLPVRIIFYAGP